MNAAPTKRPNETNKFVTSIIFAILLAIAAFILPYYLHTKLSISGVLVAISFVLSFLFATIFQVANSCPFNPVTASITSGTIGVYIFVITALLTLPVTGDFLIWIVDSAFPYIPDQPDQDIQQKVDTSNPHPPVVPILDVKNRHIYSHAFAYWMFWGGLLPMYGFLGLLGSC